MDVRVALQELADKVRAEVLRRLQSPIGINRAAGYNTLIGSRLEESIDMYVNDEGDELVFQIADYFSFIAGGRKGGFTFDDGQTYKYIQDWIRRKGIRFGDMPETRIVYLVMKKLSYADILPRPFINPDYNYEMYADEVIPFLERYVNEWCDLFFDELMKEFEKG